MCECVHINVQFTEDPRPRLIDLAKHWELKKKKRLYSIRDKLDTDKMKKQNILQKNRIYHNIPLFNYKTQI